MRFASRSSFALVFALFACGPSSSGTEPASASEGSGDGETSASAPSASSTATASATSVVDWELTGTVQITRPDAATADTSKVRFVVDFVQDTRLPTAP